MKKYRMPRNRAEFERYITYAFIAGCNHGYAIEHSNNVCEQEKLGAEYWLGKISDEEFEKRWDELRGILK